MTVGARGEFNLECNSVAVVSRLNIDYTKKMTEQEIITSLHLLEESTGKLRDLLDTTDLDDSVAKDITKAWKANQQAHEHLYKALVKFQQGADDFTMSNMF